MVVRTMQGQMHTAGKGDGKVTIPPTESEAENICKQANQRAEALGIATRYEVADK